MAMAFEFIDGALGAAASGLVWFFLLGGLIVVGAVVFGTGMLEKWSHKCIIRIPRLNGFKTIVAKGRHLKNGKFMVMYDWRTKVEVAAPKDEDTGEGNVVEGVSYTKNDIFWCKVGIDNTQIKIEPALAPGMVIAVANTMKESAVRFTKPSILDKLGIPASIILGFVIFAIAVMFGMQMISKEFSLMAGQLQESNGLWAQALKDADITIVRQEQVQPQPSQETEPPLGVVVPGG